MHAQNYIILTFGLGVFGAYMGMWSPPLYAIYADSVPSGQRSGYETVCAGAYLASTCVHKQTWCVTQRARCG